MKGFNDFVKKTNTPKNLFPILSQIFDNSEYSLELVLQDLKESYKTVLKEETVAGGYNEICDAIVMYDLNQKKYNWFVISKSNKFSEILSLIQKGLKKSPVQDYLQSSEYREEQDLSNARARAAGFKDSGDVTKAYYEK